ncbi:hypothetical protein FisN_22Hh246 [Fistulifera solaris]|uniref:Uncharacterized protein n=1 Tax=Fistulifera solaris TaxID=1519565 RepID=A0A1Z5JG27_FISSO|nr:hypothetical protein FisN_22Hh246 [Fistulifera solaris]|eukprot:GAX12939.1 hypothetical protein FisN_22Hh246 [Fistulifera solaris]
MLLHILLLSFLAIPAAHGQGCTLCADGSEPSGTIGADDCAVLAEQALANVPSISSICTDLQTRGFQYCNCPTLPEGASCSLCADGFFEIDNPNRAIPTFNTTCGDVLFSVEPEQCQRNVRAQYYCGCPEAVPSTNCSLCPLDPEAFAPDQVLSNPDRRVPPTFENTCQDYDDATSMFDEETCGQLSENLPINLSGYCGCPAGDASSEIWCTLCPEGSPVKTDTVASTAGGFQQTCGDMATVAEFVTDQQYCDSQIVSLRTTCCEGQTESPTGAPVGSPPTSEQTSPTAETPVSESSGASHVLTCFVWVLVALWWTL